MAYSPSVARKATFSGALALAVVSLSAVAVPAASAREERQLVHVALSRSPDTRARQLERLSTLDVLGVDAAHGVADVRVTPREYAYLRAQRLDVSFARGDVRGSFAAGIEKYLSPERLAARLSEIAREHPDLVRVFPIGRSHEGREILAAEITSRAGSAGAAGKPAALFNSMHHARELMTTEVAVDIIETLVSEYDTVEETKRWLDSFRVIVVPQVNPDGNALVHGGQRFWRKNAWKDRGRVTGVDINRNYPTLWGACNGSSASKASDTYRGPSAGSEPEVKAMMELVAREKPLVDISYHAYSELVIYPFGCRSERNPARDLFASVGAKVRDGIVDDAGRAGTYGLGTPPEVIYQADGNDMDWQWKEHGVMAYAIEISSSRQGFQPDYDTWRDVTVERQRGGWKALLRAMADGTVRVKPTFVPEGEVTATIHRVGPEGLEAFDGDSPERVFVPRLTGSPESPEYALLLGPGTFEVRLSDQGGNAQTRRVTIPR